MINSFTASVPQRVTMQRMPHSPSEFATSRWGDLDTHLMHRFLDLPDTIPNGRNLDRVSRFPQYTFVTNGQINRLTDRTVAELGL